MNISQKKYSIIISFFVTVLYFLIIQLVSGFVFFLNDDRTLQFILSGHSSDPSFYTFFIAWHLAMPIAGLYSLFPAFPFYGVIMLLSIFLSLWYLVYYIIKKQNNIILSLVSILLIFICLYRLMSRPTFTIAAAFAVIPIILLVLEFNFDNKNDVIKHIILISVFSLISVGFRHSVFLLSLPFIVLIIILKTVKAEKRLLIILPVLIACYAFADIGNAILQKNPEYQQALEYSKIRSEIFDHYGMPSYSGNEEFFSSLGISVEAYEMIENYYFDIPEASVENLTAIRDFQKEHLNINFANNFYQIGESYANNAELLVLVCALLLLSFIFNVKNHPRKLLLTLGFFAGTILASLGLVFLMKFPTRIASVLLLFNLGLCVYTISSVIQGIKEQRTVKYRVLRVVSICLTIAVFCCVFLPNKDAYDNSWKTQVMNDYRALEQHISSDSEYVYYTYSTVNLHYADAPLKESQKALNCVICDWNYLLPSYNEFFKNHGAKNLMDYVEQGKKLKFVISKDDVITDTCMYKYIQKVYGRSFTKVEDYRVFQIYEIV